MYNGLTMAIDSFASYVEREIPVPDGVTPSQVTTAIIVRALILAYNEVLYPYHKWFMKVLEGVASKPNNLFQLMNNVLQHKSKESLETLYECVTQFYEWPRSEKGWHIRFMLDSELNWMTGHVPVADL
ncbi:hypothetical protein GXP70_00520 [Paenibacillus lycopersici]|uniref:Uncharacterized protein n=1 Tax=Paenibacillus lycopersici TaxID=2704462 RepID=A0A6C0FT35_9BACL|nr:hypothetical protein [Paenibacillus lycopersici]QHT58611.1 hypothetical protein GXP70_00520 [Paenibacillus lycopersici]